MQSGDHIRVQDALLESSNKTATALQNLGLMDSSGEPTTDFRGRMACSAAAACVVAVVLVAAVAVAVAVVAAVVIWVWR
ncbi:MAG: hypothetical protein C4325_07395, partial [Blastocatellia bacterium]